LAGGIKKSLRAMTVHDSACSGRSEKVKLLLDRGADVNIQGGEYGNALQAAAYHGSPEIVKLLLDRGADVNIQGGEYGNALQAAAFEGSPKIMKLLLDRGANVNIQGGRYGNALQAASFKGSPETVKLLLNRGADVNIQGGLFGNALQAAAYHGSPEIVKLLLERGADVNIQGGEYGNALQAAAYHGSPEIVKLLLDNGAKAQPNAPLLHAPVESGNHALLQSLLIPATEAHVDVPDILGRTPVHLAATNGDVSMLETLFKFSQNSINFNREDIDGSTPLHCAVRSHGLRSCELAYRSWSKSGRRGFYHDDSSSNRGSIEELSDLMPPSF
jgi:ankyrin repeat protein